MSNEPQEQPRRNGEALPRPLAVLCASKLAAAEEAKRAGRQEDARALLEAVLRIDPELLEVLAAQPTVDVRPDFHQDWMAGCGEDSFGRWAVVSIAGVEHRFRYCPSGTFEMGSKSGEEGSYSDERPRHRVTLTKGFWLGEAPVTQWQWEAAAGSNPSWFKGPDLPVERVNWDACKKWMTQANSRVPGLELRFPTEAEWEYACRAGTSGANYRGGCDAATLNGIAWYDLNSIGRTHSVKQKAPNPWGLYDMLGNVWEWCVDIQRIYMEGEVVDPSAGKGKEMVVRGGSWRNAVQSARAAYRHRFSHTFTDSNIGFRLARG